ncbi:MAG: hypothetical protein GXC78_06060 [Chitinophagaceae bacterium]|nr:hypothetical protein [Chitinophagaceae bacterium]
MLIENFPLRPFEKTINLCYYIPKSNDKLSAYLIKFKDGYEYYIKEWIKFCLSELSKKEKKIRRGQAIDTDILPQIDIVIRALGSSEIIPDSAKPTYKLASSIAEHLKSNFSPDLLVKSRATKKFAIGLNKAEREKEIKGVYSLKSNVDLSNKSILIVDDVGTSHVTAVTIGNLIKSKFPTTKLYFFCLAQTERTEGLNNDTYEKEVKGKFFKDV